MSVQEETIDLMNEVIKLKAERDELIGWNEKRVKHIERLEVEGMALQVEQEKLIGALKNIKNGPKRCPSCWNKAALAKAALQK